MSNSENIPNVDQLRKQKAPKNYSFAIRKTRGQKLHHVHKAEYAAWSNMQGRCLNPKHKSFSRYGGRGLTISESWRSFAQFIADMGNKPEGTSLDRIDNNLGYSKENCRWATKKEQDRNRRSNRLMTFNGVTRCLSEWAEVQGMKRETISFRLRMGFSEYDAVFTPTKVRRAA